MKIDDVHKILVKFIFKLENISSKNKQKGESSTEVRLLKDILFDLHEIRRKLEKLYNHK
ncbi:hypothetical protein [Aliarcobacter cryaerophilus]|uniref:hypothetical protein n=1 Tax=Aliarcobacter cryaerophilus TaxID=28198 RepID=UPI0013FE10B6|nr:hypothetical protein [Aliarcobacter cryaerophilus]